MSVPASCALLLCGQRYIKGLTNKTLGIFFVSDFSYIYVAKHRF